MQAQEVIKLEVLRAAAPDVLGQTQAVQVAVPFCFGNAEGDLKKVDSYAEIRKIAAESAANFAKHLKH